MNKPQSLIAILLMTSVVGVASAQTCRDSIIATTPDSDFTVHDNGTVTHDTTGLMWMRCSLGQEWNGSSCNGSASSYTWQNALQEADGYNYAGYSDWRLPDKNELESIVEERCYNPSINSTLFPNTLSSWFWSSSPGAGYRSFAWGVHFDYSLVAFYSKHNYNQVRLVRVGQ